MSTTYNISINVTGNASVEGKKVNEIMGKITGTVDGLQKGLNKMTQKLLMFNQATQAVKDGVSGFQELSQAGLQFETSMTDLSALTGITGEKLQSIEKYARSAAKTFGGSASQSVESYKLILAQLGPAIADVPEALAAMGDAVSTLSKTMGNDTVAATDVLTTAMNQFGVSLEDPIAAAQTMKEMMNVMAAAAQEGSAELPAISEALRQSGMAAKAAGVSFEETNAAIQVLDKAGKKASEGGVALRNVLTTLAKGRFLPKVVLQELDQAGISVEALTDSSSSLGDRLRLLTPLLDDSALLAKTFGRENANAAMALIGNIDSLDFFTKAVTDSTSAQDQANVVMDSTAEKISRTQAAIEDIQIGFYNITKFIQPFSAALGQSLVPISQMIPAISLMFSGLKKLPTALSAVNMALGRTSKACLQAIIGHKAYSASLKTLTRACHSAKAAATLMHAAFLGIAGLALAGVIAGISAIARKTREAKEEAQAANEAAREAEQSYKQVLAQTSAELDTYKSKLKAVIETGADEKNIVSEMNSKYGEIFGTYDTAAKWYDILTQKSKDYVKVKVNEAKIDKLASDAAVQSLKNDELNKIIESTPKQVEGVIDSKITWYGAKITKGLVDNPSLTRLNKQLEDGKQLAADYEKQMDSLVKENININSSLTKTATDNGGGGSGDSEEEEKALEFYASLKTALEDLSTTNKALGKEKETLSDQCKLVERAITKLVPELGIEREEVQILIEQYIKLRRAKAEASIDAKTPLTPLKIVKEGQVSSQIQPVIDIPATGKSQIGKVKKDASEATQAISALGGAMASLSGVVGESAGAWLTWGGNLLQSIAQAIPAIVSLTGAQATLGSVSAITAATQAGSSVSGIPIVGPIMAVAAIASVTAALLAIPKFAEGGLAYGPTLGLFGEYSGASNNPEVVAPLDKLRGMLQPTGFADGDVVFHIKGRDLEGVWRKRQQYNGRT